MRFSTMMDQIQTMSADDKETISKFHSLLMNASTENRVALIAWIREFGNVLGHEELRRADAELFR